MSKNGLSVSMASLFSGTLQCSLGTRACVRGVCVCARAHFFKICLPSELGIGSGIIHMSARKAVAS